MSQVMKQGVVVFPEWGPLRVDLRLRDGRVAEVGEDLRPAQDEIVLDASNRYVFPGFIDPHTHLGNYNPFVEDVVSETLAAAAGGVTTVGTFLKILRHRDAQVSYKEVLPEVERQLSELASVDVACHLVLSTLQHLDEIPEYVTRGYRSFKLYIGYKASPQALKRGSVGVTDGFILEAMHAIAAAGKGGLALLHCENEDIAQAYVAKVTDPERATWLDWADTRPNVAEAESVHRACFLARESACPTYIVHLSARESLELIREAMPRATAPFHVEVNVHHLAACRSENHHSHSRGLPGRLGAKTGSLAAQHEHLS